jgi:Zn-dependent protease with chaperone function
MEKIGLVPCFVITFALATLFQATTIWQLVVIAGFIGGALAKDFITATLTGILAFLASWLLLFWLLDLVAPASIALAFSFFSLFFMIGIVLTIVLGLASTLVGYFVVAIYDERKSKRTNS